MYNLQWWCSLRWRRWSGRCNRSPSCGRSCTRWRWRWGWLPAGRWGWLYGRPMTTPPAWGCWPMWGRIPPSRDRSWSRYHLNQWIRRSRRSLSRIRSNRWRIILTDISGHAGVESVIVVHEVTEGQSGFHVIAHRQGFHCDAVVVDADVWRQRSFLQEADLGQRIAGGFAGQHCHIAIDLGHVQQLRYGRFQDHLEKSISISSFITANFFGSISFQSIFFLSIQINSNQFKSIQAISSCDRVCGKFLIGRSSSLSVRLWRPIDGVQQGTSLMMNNSTYSMLNRHWLFFQNHFWNLNLVENHPINILIVY